MAEQNNSILQSISNFMLNPITLIILVTLVFFIYILISVSKYFKKEIKQQSWPTYLSECPDYWIKDTKKDSDGNLIINPVTNEPLEFCHNVKQIGSCIDDADEEYGRDFPTIPHSLVSSYGLSAY